MHNTGFLIGCVHARKVLSAEETAAFAAAPTFADLEHRLVQYYGELKKQLQAEQVNAFIWYKYDAHNLKIMLREKYTGKAQRELLLPLGSIPLPTLEKMVGGQRPYLGVWDFVYTLPFTDAVRIARALDRFYYQQCAQAARGPGLRMLVQTMIDVANVKKCIGRETDYLPGGSRPASWWLGQEDFTGLVGSLFHVEPKEEDLEQFLDEWLFAQVLPYRYALSGVLPLILFFLQLEIEMKNIKIAYLAKQKQYRELHELTRKIYG